jgi:hypothetical protein
VYVIGVGIAIGIGIESTKTNPPADPLCGTAGGKVYENCAAVLNFFTGGTRPSGSRTVLMELIKKPPRGYPGGFYYFLTEAILFSFA